MAYRNKEQAAANRKMRVANNRTRILANRSCEWFNCNSTELLRMVPKDTNNRVRINYLHSWGRIEEQLKLYTFYCGTHWGELSRVRHRTEAASKTNKVCSNCKQLKKVSEFYQSPNYVDGWNSICIECNKTKVNVWLEENPARQQSYSIKRRLTFAKAFVEEVNPKIIYERDNGICYLCFDAVDSNLVWPHSFSASLDHVIPISKGGQHSYANIKLTHLRCNLSKKDRLN